MSYGFNGGGRTMANTTAQHKVEMQGLNDRLASYMKKLNDLKMQGAGSIDPAKYHEAMQMLENELMKIKNMYESELERLRRQLEDANREKNNIAGNMDRNSTAYNDMANKLAVATDNMRKLQDQVNHLQRALADKEKENADLRALLKAKDNELDQLRPNYGRMNNDIDSLRRRLEEETKKRQDAEEKLKQLMDKLRFSNDVNGQENRDLQDRLKVANEIIQKLEQKIRQLSQDGGDDLSRLLQKLRDANMQELKRYQRETEEALNKNLGALRNQMMDTEREKERLARERAQTEDAIRQLQKRIADLEGENQGLKQQLRNLLGELEGERSRNAAAVRDLEGKNRDLQSAMINTTKDFTSARDAQANLRNEIDQYRNLLDLGSHKLNEGVAPATAAGAHGTGPGYGSQSARPGYSSTVQLGRPKTAMPPPPAPAYGRPPSAPPPQYSSLQYSGPQSNVQRVSTDYKQGGLTHQTEYTDRYRPQQGNGLPNISGMGQSGYTRTTTAPYNTRGSDNPSQRVFSY